ncbi:MAG: ribosome small subunit-dependent GTPase A [Bacteroidales bacterium]|nr:ribosome small subunit-dependent GTPase A [Bacteroidales bacterium]
MNPDEAIVVKNAGSHFLLSRLPEWKPFPAVLRGKARLAGSTSTNPVAVGDVVRYRLEAGGTPLEGRATRGTEAGGPSADGGVSPKDELPKGEIPPAEQVAVITEVLPRRNYVIRKSTNLSRKNHVIAANLDRAVIAVSLLFPEIKLPFLDRILVTCEVYGIKPVIVLNKIDLYGDMLKDEVENFVRIYEGAGYLVIRTSCKTGEGIDELRELCSEGVSLFSGESGVGKSSLVKALDPGLDPKIGKISAAHLQGKHTTSLYEMYPLAGGGFVVDSPGLRGFGLVDLEKEEIALYFPEMLAASKGCRFTPCTHTHEPGCAVKAAVDAGTISPERYNSYLGMLEEDTKFRQ